jgi:hypothetical protein
MGHRSIVAIDPGKRSGFAMFHDGELVCAGYATDGELLGVPPLPTTKPALAVIELPVVYQRTGKGDPNDLIDLAVLVGDLRGFYRRCGVDVALVRPRTWKGTVPKAIHGERVLAVLSTEERAILKGTDHNMIDAIGLGLWQLKTEGQRA